jgi:hypothetical protein
MMGEERSLTEQLERFRREIDTYFRFNPESERARLNDREQSLKGWQQRESNELDGLKRELDGKLVSIRRIEKEIRTLDERLDRAESSGSTTRSQANLTAERKRRRDLAGRHDELGSEYESRAAEYGKRVKEYNAEQERRRVEINALIQQYNKRVANQNTWFSSRRDGAFFKDLNSFYAKLRRGELGVRCEPGRIEDMLAEVSEMRRELARYCTDGATTQDGGMLVIETKVSGDDERAERCHLVIDTASSLVTLPEEIVKVLALEKYIGEEIDLHLPANITVKARQLLIPMISAAGEEAKFVKGVILDAVSPGIDGCLGLSFLNRFDYRIEKQKTPPLILKKKLPTDGQRKFDVFISCKSEDLGYAEQVYDFLEDSGYSPFLSSKSLYAVGTTEYQKVIDAAMEEAVHLVIICSAKEYITSPWVESEWRMFESDRRSGRKWGNIAPILCGEMSPSDLPVSLRKYSAISIDMEDWQTRLINFLPRRRQGV